MGGTHAGMGREGLRAVTIGLDAGGIVHDQAHDLHGEVWVIRANLGYQVGFLDEMASKNGTLVIAVI